MARDPWGASGHLHPLRNRRQVHARWEPPSVRLVSPTGMAAPRGRGVAVAAPNDLAAQAGVGVATDGGNAVDAAVAAAVTTMVTEPGLVSLTAGGFVTVQPQEGDAVTVDGAVEMPGRGLPPERFGAAVWDVDTPYAGGTRMTIGPGSVATPGALKALDTAWRTQDRKSTRLNSSHANISYAVFCLNKKKRKCTRL